MCSQKLNKTINKLLFQHEIISQEVISNFPNNYKICFKTKGKILNNKTLIINQQIPN